MAGPIWVESGPGGYVGVGTNYDVFGWSLSSTYTGVSISFPLVDWTVGGPISGTEGIVYLMNQIGTGTTAANEVATPVTVTGLSATVQNITLFSGLTLGPGNYYLVFAQTTSLSMDLGESASGLTETTGAGVTVLGQGGGTPTGLPPTGFPPDVNVSFNAPESSGNQFSITGDPSGATPEPTTAMMAMAGGAVLLAGLRRKRVR
jgi:hypothetical protein